MIVTAEEKRCLCVARLGGENVFVRGRQLAGERVGERETMIELRVRGRVPRQFDGRMSPALHLCACLVEHIKNPQVDVRHRLEIPRAVPLLAEEHRPGASPLRLPAPGKLRCFVPFDDHQVEEPEEALQGAEDSGHHQTPVVLPQLLAGGVRDQRVEAVMGVFPLHQGSRVPVHHRAGEGGEDPQQEDHDAEEREIPAAGLLHAEEQRGAQQRLPDAQKEPGVERAGRGAEVEMRSHRRSQRDAS